MKERRRERNNKGEEERERERKSEKRAKDRSEPTGVQVLARLRALPEGSERSAVQLQLPLHQRLQLIQSQTGCTRDEVGGLLHFSR